MPIPQNGQTYSNIPSAFAEKLFECVWPFCKFGTERVKMDCRIIDSKIVVRSASVVSVPANHFGDDGREERYFGNVSHKIIKHAWNGLKMIVLPLRK